jgi:hypothetical protein
MIWNYYNFFFQHDLLLVLQMDKEFKQQQTTKLHNPPKNWRNPYLRFQNAHVIIQCHNPLLWFNLQLNFQPHPSSKQVAFRRWKFDWQVLNLEFCFNFFF